MSDAVDGTSVAQSALRKQRPFRQASPLAVVRGLPVSALYDAAI